MKVISPFLIPDNKDLGSDFLLLIKTYGKLPIIGSRGGPGGKFGGFSVPLYVIYVINTTNRTINMESIVAAKFYLAILYLRKLIIRNGIS